MPFFSRSKYLSGNGQPNVQWEEGWIVKLEQNETQAIIIAGAGGLGKTRLGLELSRGLANRGWLCLRLTNNATAERVGELVRAHIEAAKLIFFVDYAEIVDSLREIAEALDRINELQGHELRLIATCRTSALTAVRSDLADLDPIQILLSAEVAPDPQDTSYARWVVENILNYACVPNRAEIARICDGTPALAAFAAFLYQKQHEQFIRQFSNLAGLHDFQTWVNRRLDNLINRLAAAPDRGALNRRLATSIAHLPLPLAERDTITDGSDLERALFEHLEMDGWIELVDGMVLIAHDVFADSILLRYLFQHPSVATQRTRDLMRNSIENGYLDRALHSLGRLADHAVFDTINRYSIIEELKEKDRPGLLSVVDAVMYSRFLLPQDKIVLIGTDEAIRAAAERNEKASLIIGRALEFWCRLERDVRVRIGVVEALWWLGECSICISIVAQLWWRRRVDQIVFHEMDRYVKEIESNEFCLSGLA